MIKSFSSVGKQLNFAANIDGENKQNQRDWLRSQTNICAILSHLNQLVHNNMKAISELKKEITNRATSGSMINQEIGQCLVQNKQTQKYQCPSQNTINQPYLTVNNFRDTTHHPPKQSDRLTQKLDEIRDEIKRKQLQALVNLEKRLSQKGDRTEIQKALNLSKLLVVEINQIQNRFTQNQMTTKAHSQKLKLLQQTLTQIEHKRLSQSHSINQKIHPLHLELNHNQYLRENLSQALQKDFQIKIQQVAKKHKQNLQNLSQSVQNHCSSHFQQQLSSINTRILNLESHQQNTISERQIFNQEIKVQINNMSQEYLKLAQKLKQKTQLFLSKKIDSFEQLYTRKTQFIQQKQSSQKQIKKINQSLNKATYLLAARTQKLQNSFQSLQQILQNHNNYILTQVNRIEQQNSTQITQVTQQFNKALTKYTKTQNMKKYLQSENQKVYKIINNNFEQQKQVNEVLCSQNILGRWLWQNQQLKDGNLISWDKEVINTLPQNFRLSVQKSTIIEISSGGIYKLELGFYSRKKPTIQILINGKIVMSAVNSSSYVLHHSSGKLKGIEGSQMSGLTLVDFFLLPQKSRIGIAYSGDVRGQGFLNIHRL